MAQKVSTGHTIPQRTFSYSCGNFNYKEAQADMETILRSINNGREKAVAKKDMDRIKSTIKYFDEYKNHKDVLKFFK